MVTTNDLVMEKAHRIINHKSVREVYDLLRSKLQQAKTIADLRARVEEAEKGLRAIQDIPYKHIPDKPSSMFRVQCQYWNEVLAKCKSIATEALDTTRRGEVGK